MTKAKIANVFVKTPGIDKAAIVSHYRTVDDRC